MTARLLRPVLLLLLLGCTRTQQAEPPQRGEPPREAAGSRPPPSSSGQLARVRPPPAPCLASRGALPEELLDRAAEHAEARDYARALACAEEAVREEPRLVPALHLRATALVGLGRFEAAKLAFARALAVDPQDAPTLLSAADLFVSRLDGEREEVMVGLEYATRGATVARDRDLRGRLLHVAAMAENDLGLSREALAHAERGLRDRPKDPGLLHEKGVALYELVRFADARATLERALQADPDQAWTHHYLALVAEHDGDRERAERFARRARELAPKEFRALDVPSADFDAEVRRAVAALPEHERRALEDVPLELADVPALDDLTAVDPPLSPTILGLFRGPPEFEPCESGVQCRSIVLYRKNLSRFARDRAELQEQVRVTLLHELGHLHGETEDELRDRGLE